MDLVSPAAMRIIFPLKMLIGFQVDQSGRLYPIARDAVALHISAFAIEGFIDKVLHGRTSLVNPSAMLHFEKGMRLLRERLLGNDDEMKISDSTISTVLKLAGAAHFDGDYQVAKHHMDGLRRMMDLRGGVDAFRDTELFGEAVR